MSHLGASSSFGSQLAPTALGRRMQVPCLVGVFVLVPMHAKPGAQSAATRSHAAPALGWTQTTPLHSSFVPQPTLTQESPSRGSGRHTPQRSPDTIPQKADAHCVPYAHRAPTARVP